MNKDAVDEAMRDIFSTVFKRKIGKGENVVRDDEVEWDSLKHAELIFMVEGRLGIQFTETQMAELDSLEKMVNAARELI